MWRLGRCIAAGSREGILHGQAAVTANKITNCGLDVRRDHRPTTHVSIVGWPATSMDSKGAAMLIAERLCTGADAARLLLPSTD